MTKRRSGLQKSVEIVFKNAVVPEEVKLEYNQIKSELKAISHPETGVEAPALHAENSTVTPHRIPSKGAMPIYIKESTHRRKKSWWSALTGR